MRLTLSILLLFTCAAHSYKILVYIPKFAYSHINFMGTLADTLVDAGHDVTALVSEMDANLPDGTKKAKIIRISPGENANHMNTHFNFDKSLDIFDQNFDSWSGMMANAYHNSVSFCIQCRKMLTTPGLVEQLRAEKYDALITEAFEMCGVGLSHLIAPRALIPVSSSMLFYPEDFGVHYSLRREHSPLNDGRFHATIKSRLNTIYYFFMGQQFLATMHVPLHKVFTDLYPDIPSFTELLSHSAVVFSNTDPLVDFARPTISKFVPIGGIAVASPQPLDEYWSGILSLRSQTVLVSFGSIAKSAYMSPLRKAALLEAFSSFPQTTFIWKYENSSDDFARLQASKISNVILTEWMPQLDILADPRLTLFISHAGMASCHEIAHFGVPALLIPIFGDQVHNAGALAHVGIAEVFNRREMVDAEKLKAAIDEMLTKTEYKKSALRIRDQLAARPSSPVERLVKNVEFAARFGPSKSLRPLNLELSTIELLGIDLLFTVIGALVLFLAVIYFVFKITGSFILSVTVLKTSKIE